MKQSIFESAEQLNTTFSQRIVELLEKGIAEKGRASILVSGGRTPLGLFKALSETQMDWSKVDISLADERWVSTDDDASNEKLVKNNLLQGYASKASFYSLVADKADANDAIEEVSARVSAMSQPFDVLILGMGEDGHTASLFPCSAQIQQGLDLNTDQQLIAVTPTTAPHQRISFTLKALLTSQNIFLHLTGESKKQVLEQALSGDDEFAMPIRAVLSRADVELMWAA